MWRLVVNNSMFEQNIILYLCNEHKDYDAITLSCCTDESAVFRSFSCCFCVVVGANTHMYGIINFFVSKAVKLLDFCVVAVGGDKETL